MNEHKVCTIQKGEAKIKIIILIWSAHNAYGIFKSATQRIL